MSGKLPIQEHSANMIRSVFSPMAAGCQAVNLGQGFPNFPTSQFIKQAAHDAIYGNMNQYSPPKGLPRLRKALSAHFSPKFNRQLDVENEIIVTAGANEGLDWVFERFALIVNRDVCDVYGLLE
jgi:kynurenine aminotransferase